MSRRAVLIIALISLAVLGAAAAPWTLSEQGLSSSLARNMKERYGLDLTVEGRSTFAVLPIPRVKFEKVRLRTTDGSIETEGGILRGELRLLPLLFGRIELSDLALSGSRITGSLQRLQQANWSGLLSDGNGSYARRLILTNCLFHWSDWEDANLRQVNLVVSWAGGDNPLYAVGTAVWRDETVTLDQLSLNPSLLASNQLSPVALTLIAPTGKVAITGEAQFGDDPRFTGESAIQSNSVRNFTAWSGLKLPFGSLVHALSVKGDFSLNRRRLSWPSVAVTLGGDKLDGTLAVRLDAERPLITGTLAAGKLNLSGLFAPFLQTRTESGAWSEEAIDLQQVTGSNLDLRLSASTAIIGPLRLSDMAASVLVRPGRVEASVGRADLHSGMLKGRLSLAATEGAVEFKSLYTFSEVDVAPFLSVLGQPRWVTGRAQGQFQLEGTGQSPADVIRQAHGRSSITIKDGELVGLALNEVLRRAEKRPLLASLNWKGGRTPFDQTQMHVVMKDGVGAIAESRLVTPDLVTGFEGQLSLIDRNLTLKAEVTPVGTTGSATPGIGFEISGGWDNIAITPDARSLIERSGAAKPLFGSERVPANDAAAPLANAH